MFLVDFNNTLLLMIQPWRRKRQKMSSKLIFHNPNVLYIRAVEAFIQSVFHNGVVSVGVAPVGIEPATLEVLTTGSNWANNRATQD